MERWGGGDSKVPGLFLSSYPNLSTPPGGYDRLIMYSLVDSSKGLRQIDFVDSPRGATID